MSTNEYLTGKLLVAQPIIQKGPFSKSCVIVAQHDYSGAWGVIVNRPAKSIDMRAIMKAAGIEYYENEETYIGGPVESTRVQVIHTLDWFSKNTLKITKDIGITGDIGVLAAISQGNGPLMYRAGVGLAVWSAGQLDGEQSGISPWTLDHQWLTTDATLELCLSGSGDEQWQRAINECVSQKISTLF